MNMMLVMPHLSDRERELILMALYWFGSPDYNKIRARELMLVPRTVVADVFKLAQMEGWWPSKVDSILDKLEV